MAEALSQPFAEAIADRMKAAHAELATRWLDELRELLAIPAHAVFPSASLLDHIPGLIIEIAEAIGSTAEEAIVANTVVTRKAQELGTLRFTQKATVHQLLREYRLLGEVLNGFVTDQVGRQGGGVSPVEVLGVSARLHEAVFVLMQTTVDTFVSRYAATIEQQTQRLEGFNRMVSHELRQPLGAIGSAAALLAMPESTSDAVRQRCIEIVSTNTRRMATLTTTLLTLSSLDTGSIETQDVDLARLVADVAEQLGEMAGRRQVDVRLAIPPTTVHTDVARVELVVVNLMSTAIKYSDPRKDHRFVEVRAVRDADGVCLAVADNGLGIPERHRDRVFDGFYRAHAVQDGELGADGLGLGLAIVAECVRHLAGSISIESADGTGTTFHVRLPADIRDCNTSLPAPATNPT